MAGPPLHDDVYTGAEIKTDNLVICPIYFVRSLLLQRQRKASVSKRLIFVK